MALYTLRKHCLLSLVTFFQGSPLPETPYGGQKSGHDSQPPCTTNRSEGAKVNKLPELASLFMELSFRLKATHVMKEHFV